MGASSALPGYNCFGVGADTYSSRSPFVRKLRPLSETVSAEILSEYTSLPSRARGDQPRAISQGGQRAACPCVNCYDLPGLYPRELFHIASLSSIPRKFDRDVRPCSPGVLPGGLPPRLCCCQNQPRLPYHNKITARLVGTDQVMLKGQHKIVIQTRSHRQPGAQHLWAYTRIYPEGVLF